MRVAVVGGKLQGVEASYLAQKAGWEVVLIDKEPLVPAVGLCDSFCHLDVNKLMNLKSVLKKVDLIIPALENVEALGIVSRLANYLEVPVIFDAEAYAVSCSKIKSNELFARLGVPSPLAWPGCSFPIIAKPSKASGSEGVVKIRNYQEFLHFTGSPGSHIDWIIEEYLEGPSYSIEVLGYAGTYKVLQITELLMDADYDCKRVLSPVSLSPGLKEQFEQIALTIAGSLNLSGIMDVETILHDGKLKVLEIDARLPSQTPTAVYKSTGINMVEILGKAFTQEKAWAEFEVKESRGVVYEHIKVSPDRLEVAGEHIMGEVGPLNLYYDLFGADEIITDYMPGKPQWAATLIITGKNRQKAWEKRCEVIRRISYEMGINEYSDPYPPSILINNTSTGFGGCYDEIA